MARRGSPRFRIGGAEIAARTVLGAPVADQAAPIM
jgi:hypothetical protein